MLSNSNNKMKGLIKTYNMKQSIAEPTKFTENSSSLVMLRNNNDILTSGVSDTVIPDQIRYHCTTVVLLKFLRPHCKTFKKKRWNYKLTDYTKYRSLLTDSNLEETRNIFKKIFGGSKILTILTQLNDEIPLYPLSLQAGKGCSI